MTEINFKPSELTAIIRPARIPRPVGLQPQHRYQLPIRATLIGQP